MAQPARNLTGQELAIIPVAPPLVAPTAGAHAPPALRRPILYADHLAPRGPRRLTWPTFVAAELGRLLWVLLAAGPFIAILWSVS
jgi:hypothetical protein